MMASFAGLSMAGRGSSLRTFSTLSLHSSIPPARPLKPALFFLQRQLGRAPHFSSTHLLFTATRPSFFCSSSSSSSSSIVEELHLEERESVEDAATVPASPKARRPVNHKFPPLSPKEKKDLRAYAHSLGKKIVSQQIGKSGVTESLANAISDALEAKEILKLKVLDNCPDDLEDVITKIEEATQGQVVGKIGSVITLYRPSLRKLSEAEKSQNKVQQQGRPRRTTGSAQAGRRM